MDDQSGYSVGIFGEDDDLIYPFVSIASNGGPHDDESYVCGYEVGRIDAALSMLPQSVAVVRYLIHEANIQQIDLLAMHYGFTSHLGEVEDGWVTAALSRGDVAIAVLPPDGEEEGL